ncbi:hypothetical protein niasHT_002803 [Heterodera trifolii]|uniref:Uncharacterized protein n=1 Tax=Heterodera trifolii TaxID=157864 RepID=A0ABD2M889_9BILA
MKRPLSPQQIAQDLIGSVDGRQLFAFVCNTEGSGETALLKLPVNAISFLCRLVAQFGASLSTGRFVGGHLPTVDNRAMARECLRMDDDDTHSQQTKHSRAKEMKDGLGVSSEFVVIFLPIFGSSLVVHALMSAVGPIPFAINPSLDLCFDQVMLLFHGRMEPLKLSFLPIERVDIMWPGISDSDGKELQHRISQCVYKRMDTITSFVRASTIKYNFCDCCSTSATDDNDYEQSNSIANSD